MCGITGKLYFTKNQAVTKEVIHEGIKATLNRFKSNYLEFLATLTRGEEDFLTVLAQNQPVAHPRSHQFMKQLPTSPAGASKILKKLEDHAIIYKIREGYVVSDPLLALFLAEKK